MYIAPPRPDRAMTRDDLSAASRFTESARRDGRFMSSEECLRWLSWHREESAFSVEQVPFSKLDSWYFTHDNGNLVHRTGRFFTIEGLQVRLAPGLITDWRQPIIVQREIGILGILTKEFDGVLHCLMQAKMEPGNSNLVQLSPTVQATRSNYMRVHQGASIPYLEYFAEPRDSEVLYDSLQSEQGCWFLHKRNRNIVVQTTSEVELRPEFCWLTIKQIHELLAVDDIVNMDARTVLSTIPFAPPEGAQDMEGFSGALARSLDPEAPTVHSLAGAVSWLTESKARYELIQRRIPLLDVAGWHRTDERIEHEHGEYFSIVGVDVRAKNREVSAWTQPLLQPVAPGLLVLLTKWIDGVLHLLMQSRPAAGALDIVEVAPTVHCTPHTHRGLSADLAPPYLQYALDVDPSRIRYDNMQSEEGGRFLNADNRYLIIEVEDEFPEVDSSRFIWLSVHQAETLLQFGNCLNVEARSLLACLHTLW